MEHILSVKDISKTIGKKKLICSTSFELHGGHVYGFTGENGSGKTMLFRILSGLVKPTTGTVHMDGIDIHRANYRIFIFMAGFDRFREFIIFERIKQARNRKRYHRRDEESWLKP